MLRQPSARIHCRPWHRKRTIIDVDVEAATMKSLVKSVVAASIVIGASSFAPQQIQRRTTCLSDNAVAAPAAIETDPKEAVKLFGRLAEKYISEYLRAKHDNRASFILTAFNSCRPLDQVLDASAGMCCYSACTDCEYREPGGGYRMADQSAARPKWIPCYEDRNFEAQGKQHTTKWSSEIFNDGPVVTKEQFVERLINLEFKPPLGGPFLAASAAAIEDESAAAALFDVLAGEKEKLTRFRMGKAMKELANGEEGLTWAMFSEIMGAK